MAGQAKLNGGKKRIEVERPGQPLRPEQCRKYLRRTVAAAFPDVVEGFLNEAAKGGCAHLKMMSETVASRPSVRKPKAVRGAAALWLEEMARDEAAAGYGEGVDAKGAEG